MHSKLMTSQPSWTLFFSWGGFVFLSVNFFTGILLSKTVLSEFVFANVIAFVLLAITLFPTVYLSIKYDVNYSEAIKKFIAHTWLQVALISAVVIINIGWYAIQLIAIQSIFENILYLNSAIAIMVISYLFAYGSYRFDYAWLKYFSMVTMLLFLGYLVILIYSNDLTLANKTEIDNSVSFFSMVIILYGTWAFASSSVVMDISRYTKEFFKSYLYILLALLVGNFFLISLGYIFGTYTQVSSFGEFASLLGISFGSFLLLLNIWTTNDSNFFSSQKALETLGIKKQYAFSILPFLSAILAIIFQDDLFSLIGSWLKLMGWIAIPLTLFWWLQIVKLKKLDSL